jgi:hypothetical protein
MRIMYNTSLQAESYAFLKSMNIYIMLKKKCGYKHNLVTEEGTTCSKLSQKEKLYTLPRHCLE